MSTIRGIGERARAGGKVGSGGGVGVRGCGAAFALRRIDEAFDKGASQVQEERTAT